MLQSTGRMQFTHGDWKQVSQHWFQKGCYKLPSVGGYEETQVRKEKGQLRILMIITSSLQVEERIKSSRGLNISKCGSRWEGCDRDREMETDVFFYAMKLLNFLHSQKLGQVDVIPKFIDISLQICKIHAAETGRCPPVSGSLFFCSNRALGFGWTLGYRE